MADGEKTLIEMAVQLTARLPTEMIGVVNRAILQSPGATPAQARACVAQDIPHPYYRDIATDFLKCWQNCAPLLSPPEVSLCLLTASQAAQIYQKSQAVELALTGPEVEGAAFCGTEQATLQVLDSAGRTIAKEANGMSTTDECSHCGSTDLVKGVKVARSTDVLAAVGLKYRAMLVLFEVEQLHAVVCQACGTVTRLYVKETDRPWLT